MPSSRRRALIALASVAIVAVAWGCNAILGLDDVDRSARIDDGGGSDGGMGDEGAVDASLAASGKCLEDVDCPVLDPCLTVRCETATGRCLYATCQPRACERATCNAGPPRACTKTVESYPLLAAELGLGNVTVGCAADATACFAAVYPYAFVGTTSGAMAISLSDLKVLEPAQISVDLPFSPAQILASDDVVYFLGPVAAGKISIASLRVPSDPRAMRFTPTVAQVAYPFPSGRLYRAPNGDVFLVFADVAKGFPTVRLDATLHGAKAIVHVPPPVDAGGTSTVDPGTSTAMYGAFGPSFLDPDASAPASVAASSLDRLLVVQRGLPPRYALITAAGTQKANVGPAQNAFTYFPPSDFIAPPEYVTAPDGTVLVFGAIKGGIDGTHYFRDVHASWILEPSLTRLYGADYTQLSRESIEVDGGNYETIEPPLPGRALALDGEKAFFVATAKTASPSGLSVAAVRRLASSSAPIYPARLTVFDDPAGDMAPGTVGVAKAAELALVLRKTANGSKVLAFDTRCQPK